MARSRDHHRRTILFKNQKTAFIENQDMILLNENVHFIAILHRLPAAFCIKRMNQIIFSMGLSKKYFRYQGARHEVKLC
jgi:hypothetical protein